jgi:hypothetical protein
MASGDNPKRISDRQETLSTIETENSSHKETILKAQNGSGNLNRMVTKENAREWSGREGRGHQNVVASNEEQIGRDSSGQQGEVEPHFSLVQYEAPHR